MFIDLLFNYAVSIAVVIWFIVMERKWSCPIAEYGKGLKSRSCSVVSLPSVNPVFRRVFTASTLPPLNYPERQKSVWRQCLAIK